MTKREAKSWACSMASDLLDSDIAMGEIVSFFSTDPDDVRKREAMMELIRELKRRGRPQSQPDGDDANSDQD